VNDAARAAGRRLDPTRIGLTLLVVYFAARVVFLSLSLHPFVPPDEVDWFGRATYFASTLGIPEDTRESARFGLIGHEPYLYFWLIGRVLAFTASPEQHLLLARLANLPIALAAVFFVYRLACLLVPDRLSRLAVVALYTNTLQVTHIFATVSYDNLCNALAAAMFYYLVRLLEAFDARRFFAFALCAALACLTKLAMLPLVALAGLSLAVGRRGSWAADLRAVARALRPAAGATFGLCVVALAGWALAAWLYGGNLVGYGKVQVFAQEALPLDWALENRIVRRGWVMEGYRTGELSYEEARREIARIPNRGNQRRARHIVDILRAGHGRPPDLVSPGVYAAIWVQIVRDRLYGFHGNGGYVVPPLRLLAWLVLPLAALALLVFLFRLRREADARLVGHGLAISVAYLSILIGLVTYPVYRLYGALDLAVNGRYVVPLLPFLYCFGARYLVAPLGRHAKWLAFTALVALFVWSDVPHLLRHMNACWFVDAPADAGCIY